MLVVAALMRVCSPGEPYNPDLVHDEIKYTEEDDKAIDDWISDHVETTWHSLGKRVTAGNVGDVGLLMRQPGTCAMKPREEGGVVDERLNVFGTENLKCVDLSICPVRVPPWRPIETLFISCLLS